MKVSESMALLILFFLPFIVAEANETKPFEMPKVQRVPIEDTQTNRQYELYIKLPKNYSTNSDEKYPVIYITDGNWRFEMLSASSSLVRKAILVGISFEKGTNGVETRSRDYSPAEIKEWEEKTGEAKNHLAFIRNDVINYVNKNYRTLSNENTYVGYSLGGLFGVYVLLEQPDTFKNYILGSPAIGLVQQYTFQLESDTAKKRKDLEGNVFISVGELESKEEYIEPIEEFVSKLRGRNYANLNLEYVVIRSVDHDEGYPMSVLSGMYWLRHLGRE